MNVYLPYTAILPSEYQEVEYIQSTGNQYIDTGYNYNGTYFRIDIQLMFNSYSYGGTGADCPFICGVIGRSYGNMFLSLGANNHVFGLATGTQYETSIIAQLGTKFDTMLEYKSGTMTFKANDSTVTTSSTGAFYTGKSIPLFCRWDIQYSGLYSYFCTDMRMYGCKIYSAENTLARDFVPCYRKSDNVIGLYDIVNNQFYTNSGTGTFSKGSDVTMAELKNAYIGEVGEYIISNIPTTDINEYVNVARSGKTIQSVKFNFIATSDGAYVHISGNNSNSNRYGVGCGRNTSNTSADLCAIRGRLNGASDTYYRTVSYSRSGTNQIEFYINRDGNCYITVNGTKTNYTAGTAELNIIQTIMNLSNMNVYASQNGACLTGNKVDVEVTYS